MVVTMMRYRVLVNIIILVVHEMIMFHDYGHNQCIVCDYCVQCHVPSAMCGPRNFACSMCGTPWDPPDGSGILIGPPQRKQHILFVKMTCYLLRPDETQLYIPISHPSYSPPRNTGLY